MLDSILKNTMVNMNWVDVQSAANEDAIVLLPLGVIEEHGPHLCLGTDIYTAHIYCLEIKKILEGKNHEVIIAPPFYWGICQSTRGFIGSFNIRMETVTMLLFDILASLKDFGFKKVFGINAHGDINHAIAIINTFKEASEQLGIMACYPFAEDRLCHFGLSGSEPYISPLKPQKIKVSKAEVWDVHGGDVETATINTFYPHLVDTEKAKTLPDVALDQSKGEAWMFGGHIKELSADGYLGAPSCYESVDVLKNVEDYAHRISMAILTRI